MVSRLTSIAILGLLAGAACLPALASGKPRYTASTSTAIVKVLRCSRALGEAVFHGRMRSVADSERMAMRFTLLERTGMEGFQAVPAPKLGKWHRSRPGVGAFGYKQAVRNLVKGSVYRVRVDYRWYDEEGEVVGRKRRSSTSCPKETALPNLQVRLAGVRNTSSTDTDRYYVKVMNVGRAPAAGVAVRLAVDGIASGTVTVPQLYPKGAKIVTIRAPECESWVDARIDPDGLIAETWEHDNTHVLACQDLARR
jgi:hypothetical protein